MILELQKIEKSYGALMVVDGIDLMVIEGEALGVIGPNGAGKSTLFNLIAGVVRPDSGTVRIAGRDVTAASAQARVHAGVGRSFQIPHPFERLSVFENVLVAASFGQRKRESEVLDHCVAVLEETGLLDKANSNAGALTLLQRKRLEMARALATKPRLLLLDEIAGGLSEGECAELIATIKAIHARGVTVVWIEHVVHALLAVVGRLVALNFGKKIQDGAPTDVMRSREVREIYLGLEA
jgi:branched-chain amino acid transport system ATP-binding protein